MSVQCLAGMVKHFIEDGGIGEPPKISKYKKYGTIFPSGIRVCMASIIAIAHSPFYTGEYYSKLSPLWQKIAQKVRPTYKVVLRSAVDDLLGPSGVLWRPVILPKVYKYLINSETDVFDDISIMPWHSFPNVQINRQPLPVTSELPELSVEPKRMRGVGVQTDTFPAIVAAIAKEAQIGSKKIRVKIHMSRKLEIEDCELMKVFNRMMEREMHQYKAFDENHTEIPIIMSDEALAANQWFPVVIIKRSQSVENLIASLQDGEPAAKRKPSELECASASD